MKMIIIFFTFFFVSAYGFTLSAAENSESVSKNNLTQYSGYLSDVMSAELNNGKTADGLDLHTNPEKHKVVNMKSLPSAMSGYGLFIKGSDGKFSFFRFDKRGIDLAKNLLKKTKKTNSVSVNVRGELKDNILYVESIAEN